MDAAALSHADLCWGVWAGRACGCVWASLVIEKRNHLETALYIINQFPDVQKIFKCIHEVAEGFAFNILTEKVEKVPWTHFGCGGFECDSVSSLCQVFPAS